MFPSSLNFNIVNLKFEYLGIKNIDLFIETELNNIYLKGLEMINIFIGMDDRENFAYHVFTQSLIENSTEVLAISPLNLKKTNNFKSLQDGSNAFTYSRFMVPYLMNYKGWAIFFDGDMICRKDIAELWNMRDETYALQCVKHDYKTKFKIKYLNNINEDYPRKNWSSMILWNCNHPANKILTPEHIMSSSGSYLHRMSWLNNTEIGEIPKEWNYLASEYPACNDANLIHYTIGTPCFADFKNSDMSNYWKEYALRSITGLEYDLLK